MTSINPHICQEFANIELIASCLGYPVRYSNAIFLGEALLPYRRWINDVSRIVGTLIISGAHIAKNVSLRHSPPVGPH